MNIGATLLEGGMLEYFLMQRHVRLNAFNDDFG
jgi:hypothetical protein